MATTRRVFHGELEELRGGVVTLGATVLQAVHAGTDCLLDGNLKAAEAVIAGDAAIDSLTYALEERAYLILARQQPLARDLRVVIAILRVVHELERVGDLMVNVAKTTRRLYPVQLAPKVRGLIDHMREQATSQLQLAVDAFAELDAVKAAALADMDDVMDDLQKELFTAIFASSQTDGSALRRAVQVALIGRYFERAADHAVNIGERVSFMVTGRSRRDRSPLSTVPGLPEVAAGPAAVARQGH
ncbi:MAG: phosphate signaling complex protein PhoU [Acidimicrobiales bacterium]